MPLGRVRQCVSFDVLSASSQTGGGSVKSAWRWRKEKMEKREKKMKICELDRERERDRKRSRDGSKRRQGD